MYPTPNSAADRLAEPANTALPAHRAPESVAGISPTMSCEALSIAEHAPPHASGAALAVPPARRTSAQARPSGYGRRSSTM